MGRIGESLKKGGAARVGVTSILCAATTSAPIHRAAGASITGNLEAHRAEKEGRGVAGPAPLPAILGLEAPQGSEEVAQDPPESGGRVEEISSEYADGSIQRAARLLLPRNTRYRCTVRLPTRLVPLLPLLTRPARCISQ
jgi:hypothetical protein